MDGLRLATMPLLTLLLLLVLRGSFGYPDGAPNHHKVCKNLHPHHNDTRSQTSPSPYSIVLNKKDVPSGTAVKIAIISKPGFSYKGFMMQARPARGNGKPLGTFTILDPTHSKTINCFGLGENTVTHSSPVLKNSTVFKWTLLTKYKEHVIFHATVVKDFRTFWTHVTAELEVGSLDDSDHNHLNWDQLAVESSFSEENYYDTGLPQLNQMVYDECSSTKLCLGIPDDCVVNKSCDTMVTVTARESKYEFEMLGVTYVAVSLSENGDLNIDSVTECMLVDDAVVKLYQTQYEYPSGYLRQSPSNEIQLISSTYGNGMVYCKFVRNEKIELNGVRYDFKSKKYFILLASKNNTSEKTAENINLHDVKFHASEQSNYLSNVSGFSLPPVDSFSKHHGIWRLILDFISRVLLFTFRII